MNDGANIFYVVWYYSIIIAHYAHIEKLSQYNSINKCTIPHFTNILMSVVKASDLTE